MTDREFYRIFSSLLGVLIAITVILLILSHMIVSGSNLNRKTPAEQREMDKALAERIKPVGEVAIGGPNMPGNGNMSGNMMDSLISSANAAGASKGQATFETACVVCHGQGVAGAPKFGDKAAWKERIAKGTPTLHEHALKGFQGKAGFMPPKGGNPALKDEDVKAAVDYMVEKAK